MIQVPRCGCSLSESDYEIIVGLMFFIIILRELDDVFEFYIEKIKERMGGCDVDLCQITSVSGSRTVQVE